MLRASAFTILTLSTVALSTAYADERNPGSAENPLARSLELSTNVLVVSETQSAESAGYLGAQLVAMHYEGPLGLGVEAGAHQWEADGHAKWLGVVGRLALIEHTGIVECKRGGMGPSRPCLARGRLWLELGAAHEEWDVDGFDGSLHGARRRWSAGIGTDVLFDMLGGFGASVFFRLHKAKPDLAMTRFEDEVELSYETSLVFGCGFTFGVR